MSKHTPGPWRIQRSHNLSDGQYDFAIHAVKAKVIAEAFGRDTRGNLLNAAANARLIAAAPDMLADIIEAERMFRWYGDLHAAKPDPEKAARNYEMADRLAATISKATQ